MSEAPRTGAKYEIEKEIAQGGMGSVLSARDTTIGRMVAMKVMLPKMADSSDARARFEREAQVLGQLEHPNIVPIHELGIDAQGQLFYTMKLVKGETLREVIQRLKEGRGEALARYSLSQLLTIFQKVCDAMAYAHAKGVIHRDLKPENIMLGKYGEVLVMDWGLAKVQNGNRESEAGDVGRGSEQMSGVRGMARVPSDRLSTLAGSVIGTPQYMAPEQAEGRLEEIDERSDVFSLGGILYSLLSLRPPTGGTTVQEVLDNVRSGYIAPPLIYNTALRRNADGTEGDEPVRLRHCPDGQIPESLSAVVMKAMAVKPVQRYQSVTEFQADIAAYQGGFVTGAEKAGLGKQIKLLVRRHAAVAFTAFVAWFIITALVVWFVFSIKRERDQGAITLTRLRGTAPTMAAQAHALIEEQKFDEALKQINLAIELDDANADYHLFRADTLQSTARLVESIKSYQRVLALREDEAARANLELCQKLLAENGGKTTLPTPLKTKLLDAILAQKRQADAVPLSRELKRDGDTAETTIKTRLKAIIAQPGWKPDKLKRLSDGTFNLQLAGLRISDVSILDGLPISNLDIGGLDPIDLRPLREVPLTQLSLGNRPISDISALNGMRLRSLVLSGTKLSDLSPLAGMPLESLWINGSNVNDLSPLRGLKLVYLNLQDTKIADLSPLKGMKLKELILAHTPVTDLSPLVGMPLESLNLQQTQFTDWSPLRGMPLKRLHAPSTGIRDLRALRDLPLEYLTLHNSALESLDGIQKMPLRELNIGGTKVEDLSPLRGSPVKNLWVGGCGRIRDLTPLADCKQLEALAVPTHISDIAFLKKLPNLKRVKQEIGGAISWYVGDLTPAADFWKMNGERLARQAPMEKQLEQFRQSLIKQGNEPGKIPRWAFDEGGDLFIKFERLKCSDISDLRGVAVTGFEVRNSQIRDLSPLEGAPLRHLYLSDTPVADLSPIRGAHLGLLVAVGTRVRDVTVLRGMPLRSVFLSASPVDDVGPLADIPTLESVILPTTPKNIELLRRLPRLQFIGYGWDNVRNRPDSSVEEFWKAFDAKQKK